jgi:glycyl-tRNA synthetase
MPLIDKLEDIAKHRGFFWPSQEIYGGVSGFYDYGPIGTLLKLNIEKTIRDHFISLGCLLVESPVLTSLRPWVASGHVKGFADMLTECTRCNEAYRADHLVEENMKISTEGKKAAEIEGLLKGLKCPKCSGTLGNISDYNLMFRSTIGPGKDKIEAALRPETAQTTYINFRRLFEIGRKKLPLCVLQLGKSFRNEISPRKALVRLREFSQAEAQFFVHPKRKKWDLGDVANIESTVLSKEDQEKDGKPKRMKIPELTKLCNSMTACFLAQSLLLYKRMGIDANKLQLRQHRDGERSFYSSDTWDVEFMSERYGHIELVGVADRTDYDLKRHQEVSGQGMEITYEGEKFVPHVIEAAYGIDRPLLCILESCLKQDGDRIYFSFPPAIAPYQVAVFPLVNKGGLPEKAREIFDGLRSEFNCLYDCSGSIGRLYYRQDEVGTSFCITVDYDTLKDNTVTVRDRDTKKQVRIKISELKETLSRLINREIEFENDGKPL